MDGREDSGKKSVSVIAEWENALLSEAKRSRAMLTELQQQVSELAREPGGPKFELLLVFDEKEFNSADLEALLAKCLGEPNSVLNWRLLPALENGYYENKNYGVSQATGDTIVFLDSDIIPEPGWLRQILATLDMPDVTVATGNTYIETCGLVAKSFALTWFFPLRCEDGPAREVRNFFANNLAMRRSFCLKHPFPKLPDSTRAAGVVLANQLAAKDIPIHLNPSAHVSHPSPNGLAHISKRALAHGRDRVVVARRLGHHKMASWPASFPRLAYHLTRSAWNSCTRFRRVGLNPFLVPAAIAISTYYYFLFWVGELMFHLKVPAINRIRV